MTAQDNSPTSAQGNEKTGDRAGRLSQAEAKTTEEEVQKQNNLRASVTGSTLGAHWQLLSKSGRKKNRVLLANKEVLQVGSSVPLPEVRCVPAGTCEDKLSMK